MAAVPAPDPALDSQLFRKGDDAKRGIPEAIFIENVEELCSTRKPTDVVARLQDLYSKYQYMQSSIVAQRSGLKTKLPDIASALETVNHLIAKREAAADGEAEYTYQLAENIYAKASATATNCVCLWLGANCMLEYSLEEAKELLTNNETNAKTMLANLEEDMAFLRDQLTTTEVNIARCHNFGVKVRQKEKETAEKAGGAQGGGAQAAATGSAQAFVPPPRPEEPLGEPGSFTWKQDREEVEVSVVLPKDAQKADVKVTILAESLRVDHAGKVVREGRLAARCSPNGSTWTIGRGRVEISLEKAEAAQWPSLFEETDA
mmetsp:Transcript_19069/g.38529  ORF Transcript_19069/g.38529 Transcript_19069/m.38529 type:complete len:319 (-) Transcript_19069:107-1063(-)